MADQVHFAQGDYRREWGWGFWRTKMGCGDLGGYVTAESLVGATVNLGDKNGGLWDHVRVTAFDRVDGTLTIEGGKYQWLDSEVRPFEKPVEIALTEIARGYTHETEEKHDE